MSKQTKRQQTCDHDWEQIGSHDVCFKCTARRLHQKPAVPLINPCPVDQKKSNPQSE